MKYKNIKVKKAGTGNDKDAIVTIEYDFTINNVEIIHKELADAFKEYDNLKILLKRINNLDLAAIQVLLALKKETGIGKKSIEIKPELSVELSNIISNSGLIDLIQA